MQGSSKDITEIRWLTFMFADNLVRSIIHFFPSSGAVSAPYPANCRLAIFAKGITPRSVTVEGARFSQPDGIRIEDAFPELAEGRVGPVGLEFELSTSQPRVSVTNSIIAVELCYRGGTVKFLPKSANQMADSDSSEPILVVCDGQLTTSIIAINRTTQAVKAGIKLYNSSGGEVRLMQPELPADGTEEILLKGILSGGGFIEFTDAAEPGRGYFVLYREALTNRIVSVVSV